MKIQGSTQTVYFAPSSGRRYLSLRAAANAEADHMVRWKYPTEKGDITDEFYYWSYKEDPRLVRVNARLRRMLMRQFKAAQA